MSRWPSNSRGRLAQAAMGMFAERGFDQTTVADIAARAGLTERTFFRHFSDKREVLFHGGSHLEEVMTAAVAAAPPDATPLAAVAAGVAAVGPAFEGGRTGSRLRQSIIETHPDLQEREAAKLCHLGLALAESLRAAASRNRWRASWPTSGSRSSARRSPSGWPARTTTSAP
ncbi:TetR family transcriptional regulator [Catenulispora yoronensis]